MMPFGGEVFGHKIMSQSPLNKDMLESSWSACKHGETRSPVDCSLDTCELEHFQHGTYGFSAPQ